MTSSSSFAIPARQQTRTPSPPRRQGAGWLLLVMAKEPLAGRVKTRLSPALSPREAAEVAAASLADTLEAVAGCAADRKIVALDGAPGPWLPPGVVVIPQRGVSLAERLAAAWADCGGPGLQIGMDTPQVTTELLNECLAATADPRSTASLGLASDGGWWAIGSRRGWGRDVFRGVPMSTRGTGKAQLDGLRRHGHRVRQLPVLRDVDYFDDAVAVAAAVPDSRFAAALRRCAAAPPAGVPA